MEKCRICGSSGPFTTLRARELRFGSLEEFIYLECPSCEVLQIGEIPDDLHRFYPASFPSFKTKDQLGTLKKRLRYFRARYSVERKSFFGRLLSIVKPDKKLLALRPLEIRTTTKILDVGCGSGAFLMDLASLGCHELYGIDKFLVSDESLDPTRGFQVFRGTIQDVHGGKFSIPEGGFDLIVFNHSLEHLTSPLDDLRFAGELLSDDGACLVRVPMKDSLAWEQYKEYWYQLDAPRHLYLFSFSAFNQLASHAGLSLERTEHDSTGIQFWGSQDYVRLYASPEGPRRYWVLDTFLARLFTKLIASYRAAKANRSGNGDQCSFYLKRRSLTD